MPLRELGASGVEEVVRFRAGPLRLEGRLSYPETQEPLGAVVVAGPHPLLGGDMDNNVVRGLSAGLVRRGIAALTFNYRGVGGSEGAPPDVAEHVAEFWRTSHVSNEPEMGADLRGALSALKEFVGAEVPVALAGYSFGCSLLPGAGAGRACPMALIAPTVGTHDYSTFADVSNPLLVLAPHADFATDEEQLAAWFASLGAPRRIVRKQWDDHFFRGFEDELAEQVSDFLRDHWGASPCV